MRYVLIYRFCQILVAIATPVICYSLGQMIPAGINGQTGTVWRWFAVCMGAVAVGCASFVAMTYYKAKLSTSSILETEAKALAAASAEMTPQHPADETPETPTPKQGVQ